MIFLSALIHQAIFDSENRRVGTLKDIYVAPNETFPIITALIVNTTVSGGQIIVPWSQIQNIEEIPLRLSQPQTNIRPYEPHSEELLLKRDILDKQIVDTQGFRVVKVNDLKLAQIKKTARLVGVDISFSGLLRRLGWQKAIDMIGRITPIQLNERTVTWNYVEPIEVIHHQTTSQMAAIPTGTVATAAVGVIPQLQLNVSHNKLASLHPADIADILEQLDVEEAGAMLERLDDETAADTLNEVEYPLQSELLSELDPERASDLLERLAPDDAADILAEMPANEAERLLNLMPAEEAQPIRELLRYGAETAGGIMTTEFLAQPAETTVEEVLIYLRQHSSQLDMVYYLYVVDEERHLIGVASLRQIVTAEPHIQLGALMDHDVIRVNVNADQEEVANVIAKYDLLGVPVVDDEDHLLGMITVDDVIDVIQEEQAEDFSEMAGTDVEESEEDEHSWLRSTMSRSSWLLVNVGAGFIMALIILRTFGTLFHSALAFAQIGGLIPNLTAHLATTAILCLIPMLLLTSGNAGAQALGIAGWELRTKRGRDFFRGLWRELLHGAIGGVIATVLVSLLAWVLFGSVLLSFMIGLGFGITLLIAALCGMILPNILQRCHLRGSLISAPLLNPVIALASLGTFLTVTMTLFNEFLK
ncbi:MAG TPA: magnesium transporter [Dictyobacter sp.]|jgi:Mg2+ transporter MgtE|nr:magnesium transporter [Dictyobacter sp.]